MIVIDFIDMEEAANQREVFDSLNAALKKDKARSKLLPISELGLIEMTRKRTRESLMQLLCSPCSTCDATGHVKATATIAYEVLRRVQREAALNQKMSQITAHVHPSVAQYLHQHEERTLQGLEAKLGKKIIVKAVTDLDESRYEVTGVEAAA